MKNPQPYPLTPSAKRMVPSLQTPTKEAQDLLRLHNISPRKQPRIMHELVSYNALARQVRALSKGKRVAVMRKGNMRQPRMASTIAKRIGLDRKNVFTKQRVRRAKRMRRARDKESVVIFLQRSDNSTPLPGKKDALAKGKQKYALNDTLTNLYDKYVKENPNRNISLTTFQRQRPFWMKTIQWAERRQCLCLKHENASLLLKAVKETLSPNTFLQRNIGDEIGNVVEALPQDIVTFSEWLKEDVPYKGTILKKIRLQQHQELSKENFLIKFTDVFTDLREHVRIIDTQREQIDYMRNCLEPGIEITCQLDYAENYNCCYQDEPSHVFFDKQQVTIHPMVIHYKEGENLLHKSYVGITSETNHSAPTTIAFLTKLVEEVKVMLPGLRMIHYVSDSPASQYRNKSIMQFLGKHTALFGVVATWDYLEAGHGKGPCDGVGGSIKRSADIAVKKGTTIISSAKDFFSWASRNEESAITALYINAGNIEAGKRHIKNATLVKGISKVHSVREYDGILWMRETSCHQACCSITPTCEGWISTEMAVEHAEPEEPEVEHAEPEEPEVEQEMAEDAEPANETVHNQAVLYNVGDLVEAQYGSRRYRGRVIEYDTESSDYFISFMQGKKDGTFIWPKRKDEVWVTSANVLHLIN